MESNKLPVDVQERLKKDAEAATDKEEVRLKALNQEYGRMVSQLHGHEAGYIAGATAEAEWKVKYDELAVENERLNDQCQRQHEKNKIASEQYTRLSAEHRQLKARCEKMADVFRTIINAPVPGNAFQYMAWFVTAKNIAGGAISEWEAEQYVAEIKEGESNTPAPAKEIEYMPILSAELSELRKYANVPARVPMYLLNEEQAHRNHGQTLQRLKERGGLGIKEALSLITCTNWSYYRDLPMKEALAMLNDLISNNTPAPGEGEKEVGGE